MDGHDSSTLQAPPPKFILSARTSDSLWREARDVSLCDTDAGSAVAQSYHLYNVISLEDVLFNARRTKLRDRLSTVAQLGVVRVRDSGGILATILGGFCDRESCQNRHPL